MTCDSEIAFFFKQVFHSFQKKTLHFDLSIFVTERKLLSYPESFALVLMNPQRDTSANTANQTSPIRAVWSGSTVITGITQVTSFFLKKKYQKQMD